MVSVKSKSLSLIIASALIFSLFIVLTFETLHAGHEAHCHEENCPVCLVLQIIKNNVKKSDSPVCLNQFLHFIFKDLIISLFTLHFISLTPVTRKIKLTI